MCVEETNLRHLPGMLHRDQRTAITIDSIRLHNQSLEERCLECMHCRRSTTSICWRTHANRYSSANSCKTNGHTRNSKANKYIRRLAELLLVCICLLGSASVPSEAAPAPARSPMNDRRPKWVNPCGMGDEPQDTELEFPRLTDADLLDQIVVQAKNALAEASSFRDEYVRHTFSVDFQEHHDAWRSTRYEWLTNLEQIPKTLGESAPVDHLRDLQLDSALVDSYEQLQRFAVGLEQIVWDQEGPPASHFKARFRDAEYKLRAVLCEIQVAMIERGVSPKEDVPREVMDPKYRQMEDTSFRNLRDWLIYRDYMNALEYIISVFEHLKSEL